VDVEDHGWRAAVEPDIGVHRILHELDELLQPLSGPVGPRRRSASTSRHPSARVSRLTCFTFSGTEIGFERKGDPAQLDVLAARHRAPTFFTG
jgi:hypothetical protein